MSSEKPVIAVTGPDAGGSVAWWFTRFAIKRAGGIPIRLSPSDIAGDNGKKFHALILGGGADINPDHYGQERLKRPYRDEDRRTLLRIGLDYLVAFFTYLLRRSLGLREANQLDLKRDDFEISLLRHSIERHIPVLGICRGAQLINVFFGGSLHQTLQPFYSEDPEIYSVLPRKKICIEDQSVLKRLFGRSEIRVNALHKQAADRIGRDIRVTGRDVFGLAQALEHQRASFVLGVQWHPEYMPQSQIQQKLFAELVKVAGNNGQGSGGDGN